MHVGAPRGRRYLQYFAAATQLESEILQNGDGVLPRQIKSAQALYFGQREVNHPAPLRHAPGDHGFRRFAAADIEHQPGRQLQTWNDEVRIYATLKAVTGVRDDAEKTAGTGGAYGVKPG